MNVNVSGMRTSHWLRLRWDTWWAARSPRQDQISLSQRNIYIVPSRAGWAFAGVVLVLLLASINEQINLGYALSFLLSGTALSAVYLTHGNLQGLTLRFQHARSVHAGQVLNVGIVLNSSNPRQGRFGLWITAGTKPPANATQGPVHPQSADLQAGRECPLELDIATQEHGWLTLPRIVIETRYPLGLFRAWAYWRPQTRVLIWPALEASPPPLPNLTHAGMPQASHASANALEVPEGLREYRRGDPMRRIAWKKSFHAPTSGTGLISREPNTGQSPDVWLDFEHSPGLHALSEQARLSRLATWLLMAEEAAAAGGVRYGLRLPGQETPCQAGNAHLRHCLDALALWQRQAPPKHLGRMPGQRA